MSLKCEWFVLAERVLCDADSQQLTIVNCLERVGALRFPAQHHGFAFAALFRWTGEPLTQELRVTHRLVRLSEGRAAEVVAELDGYWAPGTDRGRVWVNFQVLRLFQAECAQFRIDHRIGGRRWTLGPLCTLDIVKISITDEQRSAWEQEMLQKGIPLLQDNS